MDPIATNFDDFIPQLFIKNSCKGRLIAPPPLAQPRSVPSPNRFPSVSHTGDKSAKTVAHTGDKLYKCNFCVFSSYSKYTVRVHTKTHDGEDLACHLCTFKTINKNDLQQHVKGHVNEKVYKCAYCNFQTLYKTGLKTHLLRHSGVKPFKCSQCEYRAFQKIHVERHAATHTSEKSKYQCHACQFKTAFKIRLDRHLQDHEEEDTANRRRNTTERIRCEMCEYEGDENMVLLHLVEAHDVDKL